MPQQLPFHRPRCQLLPCRCADSRPGDCQLVPPLGLWPSWGCALSDAVLRSCPVASAGLPAWAFERRVVLQDPLAGLLGMPSGAASLPRSSGGSQQMQQAPTHQPSADPFAGMTQPLTQPSKAVQDRPLAAAIGLHAVHTVFTRAGGQTAAACWTGRQPAPPHLRVVHASTSWRASCWSFWLWLRTVAQPTAQDHCTALGAGWVSCNLAAILACMSQAWAEGAPQQAQRRLGQPLFSGWSSTRKASASPLPSPRRPGSRP